MDSISGNLGYINGCRDRTAARATLGRELPALALSICEVGASFHYRPRFRRPPMSSRVGIELRCAQCLMTSTFPQAPLRSATVGFPE